MSDQPRDGTTGEGPDDAGSDREAPPGRTAPIGEARPDNEAPPDPAPAPTDRPPADRRHFLRQLSGDAVVTAGRVAGFSTLLTRSISAAGASVARDLEGLAGGDDGDAQPAPTPPAPTTPAPMPATAAPAPVAATTKGPAAAPGSATTGSPTTDAAGSDAVERLTADQRAFLAATTAGVLAVNDRAGAPHVAMTDLAWDGAAFTIASQLFGARSGHIEADPRVTVLLEDRASGAWVTVRGLAALEDPRPADDEVTIRIRPTGFVWRPASARAQPGAKTG